MLGGEPHESLTPEDREAEREQSVRVGQVGPRELRDATQTVAHGVAVEVQLARDAVHASLKTQVRVERLHQIVVARVRAERPEDAVGERADLARGLTEHEAVRTQVVEVRRAPLAVSRAPERESLLSLDEGEMRARRTRLWTGDAGGELAVGNIGGHACAQPLPFAARVYGRGRRDDRRDETSGGANDARVLGDSRRDRGAKLRRRTSVSARERDREVPGVARTCPLNKKSLPFWEAFGSSLVLVC